MSRNTYLLNYEIDKLHGRKLDYAVAKAMGDKLITVLAGDALVRNNDGLLSPSKNNPLVKFEPTVNPSQIWEMVETHGISIHKVPGSENTDCHKWVATVTVKNADPVTEFYAAGDTALEAICKCFVRYINYPNTTVEIPHHMI